MPEENRKTLKDSLLEGGAEGRQFIASSKAGKKVYVVLGYDEKSGKLSVKYNDNRKAALDIKTHANDLEIAAELREGEFYGLVSGTKDYVAFYQNGKLIDVNGKELDAKTVKGLTHIKDPTDYAHSLRQASQKSERCAYFIESQLEKKLREAEIKVPELGLADSGLDLIAPELEIPEPVVPNLDNLPELEVPEADAEYKLAPADSEIPPELTDADTRRIPGDGVFVLGEKEYPIDKDEKLNVIPGESSLEELEGDVNIDSFGSGSGLLDLSLQADDTSLGGILDEIYTAEEQKPETPKPGESQTPEPEYPIDKDKQLNASKEEAEALRGVEGDILMDSFGSGSGLLDLSLQADDTSLGGILDEIYTEEEPAETRVLDEIPPTQDAPILKNPTKKRNPFRRIWDWYRE